MSAFHPLRTFPPNLVIYAQVGPEPNGQRVPHWVPAIGGMTQCDWRDARAPVSASSISSSSRTWFGMTDRVRAVPAFAESGTGVLR